MFPNCYSYVWLPPSLEFLLTRKPSISQNQRIPPIEPLHLQHAGGYAYPKPAYPTTTPAYPKYPALTYPKPSYPAPAPPAYPKPSYPVPAPPAYPKPSYPVPAPPAYPKPAYPEPAYPKSAYPTAYGQKYDYCDPRKAPKCSNNGTETYCIKDSEYPEKEVKVCSALLLYNITNNK